MADSAAKFSINFSFNGFDEVATATPTDYLLVGQAGDDNKITLSNLVNKSYIDSLNVDADTLDGIDSTGFSLSGHTHAISDVTNLQTSLDGKVSIAGDTMTGLLILPASTTGSAALRIPPGSTPTTPTNGDIWNTNVNTYVRLNGTTHAFMTKSGGTFTGGVTFSTSASWSNNSPLYFKDTVGTDQLGIYMSAGNNLIVGDIDVPLRLDSSVNPVAKVGASSYTLWHAGNDGSGSGLDADLLDGLNSTQFVRTDASSSMTGDLYLTSGNKIYLQGGGSVAEQYQMWTHVDGRLIIAPYDDGAWQWGREFGYNPGSNMWYADTNMNIGGGVAIHTSNVSSLPSSSVGVSKLSRGTGSVTTSSYWSVHQYTFGSPTAYNDSGNYVRAQSFWNPWDTGRTWQANDAGTGSVSGRSPNLTWDYLTGSGEPRIWATIDTQGNIVGMWEAEDPVDKEFPDEAPIPAEDGLTLVQVQIPEEALIKSVQNLVIPAVSRMPDWAGPSRYNANTPTDLINQSARYFMLDRGLEVPDDIRAVYADIDDEEKRHWRLQLWLRSVSRVQKGHKNVSLIPLYKDVFRVLPNGKLVTK